MKLGSTDDDDMRHVNNYLEIYVLERSRVLTAYSQMPKL